MDNLDGSPVQIAGGLLMLAFLFALREFAAGALRQAGEDVWGWGKRRRRKPKCGNEKK